MNFNAGDKAEIIIGKNSVFANNKAGKNGGAIANWAGIVTIQNNALFYANASILNGGAIYNDNYGGNASIILNDEIIFENNSANALGGAIYNNGTMTIGTVVFSGNKADGKLNDIHNTGTLNFIGNVTLDGGISGNGTVIFANNTTLTVKTDTTIISNNIINQGAKLSLVFENGYEGGNYTLVSEEGSLDKEFKITENSLYDIIPITNGTYQISKKELTEVIDITDANHNQMNTINAIISGSSDSENFNNIANHISALLQSSQQSVFNP